MLSDRDYMQPGRAWRPRASARQSVVKPLIWANVIMFLLTGLGRNHDIIGLISLSPPSVKSLQVWRFFTYMFSHGGLMHILFNMWGLFIFGTPLEQRLGTRQFLRLYFVSGLVGGGVWLAVNWSSFPAQSVIGASGAVFGIMMAAAMVFPNERIVLLFPPIPMRLKTFVFVFALIEVMLALQESEGQIARTAHLGGILGAFFYMHRLRRAAVPGRRTGAPAAGRDIWQQFRAWFRRQRFQRAEPPPPDRGRADDPNLSAETDRILDKIGSRGLSSLTTVERRTLDRARERLRGRNE